MKPARSSPVPPHAPPGPASDARHLAEPTGGRFQFSLFTLMQIMLVTTVLGVVGGRLRPALEAERSGRVVFVFFTLLGPMALLVALAATHAVWKGIRRGQRTRPAVIVRDSDPR